MHTINPEVLLFFKALAENNSREWFEPQKPRFSYLSGCAVFKKQNSFQNPFWNEF